MKIYLACNVWDHYKELVKKCNHAHLLVSFAYISQTEKINPIEWIIKDHYPINGLIIDSGAFTAWTTNKTIDLNAYIDFCHAVNERFSPTIKKLTIVNLDVIPGKMGEFVTEKDRQESAELGWKNFEVMKKAGLKPVHIFHQFEEEHWLDKLMADDGDYIGISPSNDCTITQKQEWLNWVFYKIRNKKKTHGFGVTAEKLVKSYPWYSVDSTSWLAGFKFGNIKTLKNRVSFNGLHSRDEDHVAVWTMQRIKELQTLEKETTDIWASRGVVWGD